MTETHDQSELLESCATLTPIPQETARAYANALPALVQRVNDQISRHPRYQDWLGGNAPHLLADNHRHHGLFMDEVFSAGQFPLLALTLPWVYHTYHAHGVPYDYFQAELHCWKHAIEATLPSPQATAIGAVYDWMLARHDCVIALAEQRSEQATDIDPTSADLVDALLTALRTSDDDRALQLLRGVRESGATLPDVLQGLVYPVMQRVGSLWENNDISVADEHEATAIVNRVLAALYFDEPFPRQRRGLAVVAASVNEFHELGAWMVATCLELDGWDVEYLGANMPQHDLVAKTRDRQPQLVALSVSMPFNLAGARSTIAALRGQVPQARVMVGGQVFQRLPSVADHLGADVCLASCQDAVTWAREHASQPADARGPSA